MFKHPSILFASKFLAAALVCGVLLSGSLNSFADKGKGKSFNNSSYGDNSNTNACSYTNAFSYTNACSTTNVMWLNHFALLPGDPSVQTSYNAVSSGVGGGLTALDVESTTTGENTENEGNKVVQMAVQVPPGYDIIGVRIGYELTSSNSFISQIRLAQVQDPPATALVLLDDPTAQTATGPVYVDSQPTLVDPEGGPILLSLRVNFGSTNDIIAIRGLGLLLKSNHPYD